MKKCWPYWSSYGYRFSAAEIKRRRPEADKSFCTRQSKTTRMPVTSTLFVFLLLTSVSVSLFSKSIGTVLYTINNVQATQAGTTRTLTRGSTLFTGETIVTSQGASAQIKYLNGTLVTIQQNSHYETIAYEPNASLSLKTKLAPGAIEYTSSGKKKSTLQTPVVALAIMGTAFKAIATLKKTYIEVTEGLVVANGIKIGPGQTYTSGSFDETGRFTPESIPWASFVQQALYLNYFDNNSTIELTEIMPRLIEDNAMIPAIQTIAPLVGIASIAFIF